MPARWGSRHAPYIIRLGITCFMAVNQGTLEQIKCAAEQQSAEQQSAEQRRREDGSEPEGGRLPQPAFGGVIPILRDRDFRLLWTGEFVSLVGGQFFLVALPWLVLLLTGNALAIGTVVAVSTAPRTVFILLGGGLTDRFSPRRVMQYSNASRMVLTALLAILTATGLVQLWMLYAISLILGLGFAFYLPAQSAIIPRLVPEDRLQTGNAIIQGTVQLSVLMGPALAGVLIAFSGERGSEAAGSPGVSGIAVALVLTAASFLVSVITLHMIKAANERSEGRRDAHRDGLLRSVGEGLARVWRDKTLRLYFALIGAVNLALLGPLSVGIPILAHSRFSGGVLAYGAILSGLGAGALLGVLAAGLLRRPSGRLFPAAMLCSTVALGIGLAILGAVHFTGLAVAAAFVIGIAAGYLTVEFITWLQLRTSTKELGRMMSILLFASAGMAPISNVIAGALIGVQPTLALIGFGGFIVLVAVIAALRPSVWRLSEAGGRPADAASG